MRTMSIRSLMGVIVLCGVAMVALRDTQGFWDGVVYTATLGFLIFAILACVHANGARRAGWLGVILAGWSYWAVAFLPWFETVRAPLVTDRMVRMISKPDNEPTIAAARRNLYVSQVALREYSEVLTKAQRVARSPQDPSVVAMASTVRNLQADLASQTQAIEDARVTPLGRRLFPGALKPIQFARSAHSLFSLMAAGLGALASGWLHRRARMGEARAEIESQETCMT